MNVPTGQTYRLVDRGAPGLACDEHGVSLGDVWLVRPVANEAPAKRWVVRPLGELGDILELAYGTQRLDVVQRCHRGLNRAAQQLRIGDLAHASLEAVLIGFPDLTPLAMAKLAPLADLEKAGTAWQDQPRVPAGQTGGGQWTSEGGTATPGAAANDNQPAVGAEPRRLRSRNEGGNRRILSPADGGARPVLDDGIYRPDTDRPVRVLTGGGAEGTEEGSPRRIGGNEPPDDFMTLQDVFPALKDNPAVAIPLAPIDSFLGVSSLANEANLEAAIAEYTKLTDQIRAIDPTWRDQELQRLEDMSWQGRNNVLNRLLFVRASAYYRVRGEIRPLQVETLRFLRDAVDKAYEQAIREYNNGQLKVPVSRQLAIGNRVDKLVREQLGELFRNYGIRYGRGQNITINNRDPSSSDQTYRLPDARLSKVSFDWSLIFKTISDAQIRGFFRADSEPDLIIIVRPSQLGGLSVYAIPRPAGVIRRWSHGAQIS